MSQKVKRRSKWSVRRRRFAKRMHYTPKYPRKTRRVRTFVHPIIRIKRTTKNTRVRKKRRGGSQRMARHRGGTVSKDDVAENVKSISCKCPMHNMNDLTGNCMCDFSTTDKETNESSLKYTKLTRTLKIMTYNIYTLHCTNSGKHISEFILGDDIDILCTQEDLPLDGLNGEYKPMINCGGTKAERVQMYVKKDIAENYNANAVCISHKETKKNDFPERFAIITTLTLPNTQKFTVCTMHLEGGRFSDTKLLSHFPEIMKHKLGLLDKVINADPDIICGDFNSVYSDDSVLLDPFLTGQHKYFHGKVYQNKKTIDMALIRQLNLAPYQKLKAKGYLYASPENEKVLVTNGRGLSNIDGFWYKPQTTSINSCMIVDKGGGKGFDETTCTFSDHNPVKVECTIR